ncbi:conserved protein of unknown function [Acidithiobacillus ferrivorans]|uniref:Uncharacterized protein n=2 Tax=Acidithiobacillus TaxID=119977 RepID=A0A060UKW9_9PROT|nr:conserved hypothetical protein [Acidithiobacillus ferrivorans]SMH66673.1 conserved protein of unknown function [Acidithiobacillus ferrivorans]
MAGTGAWFRPGRSSARPGRCRGRRYMLDFSPIICELQGWSQGWLGIALTVAGLTLAVALMVYLRWYMGIVYVFIGALGLYYGWPILEDWFHIQLDCSVVQSQFAQFEHYQQNTATCENNLLVVDSQTGEDCSCNGQSATPQCISYATACSNQMSLYETTNNTCSCATAVRTGNATPVCVNYPIASTPTVTNTAQYQCSSTSFAWAPTDYCSNPAYANIKATATFIYPANGGTKFGAGAIVGTAYYTMQTTIDNPTGQPIPASWYAQTDDSGWYFLNGHQVASSPMSYSQMNRYPITLNPGANTLDVTVWNWPGNNPQPPYNNPNPTGTVDEITGTGGNTIYSATGNGSWRMVAGPPTTPTNLPASRTNCYTQSCATP